MNLQHLRYALEVEKTGSISQAAEALYMGQPNLSKAIKDLEGSMGILIFKRTSKGVVPTKQGAEFLDYARGILEQIDEMESYYSPASANKQTLRVSVPRASYIAAAFTRFVALLDMNADMEIDFCETNSIQAARNVSEEDFALGIMRYRSEHEDYFSQYILHQGLAARDLWEFKYLLLLSAHHPLAAKGEITYADLNSSIEIVHGDLSVPYLTSKHQPSEEKKHKKRILIYERGSEFDLLSRIHNTYMWVSPMPQDILERNSLVQQPCTDEHSAYKDVLVYRTGHRFSKLEKLFLEQVDAMKLEVGAAAPLHRPAPGTKPNANRGFNRRFTP